MERVCTNISGNYHGCNKFKEPTKRFVPWLLDLNNVESRLILWRN